MVFQSPDFAKLRFRKTLRQKEASFSLNGKLCKIFFAVEENRTAAQIAAELHISLADARQGLENLYAQGVIAPLTDQIPHLPDSIMAQIQHRLGRALGSQTRACSEILKVIRHTSEDGRRIHLTQARTFLNRLCDRIPQAPARQQFRTQVAALLRERLTPALSGMGSPGSEDTGRGRTHAIIAAIIAARSRGNPSHVARIKDAFRRYGIDPDRHRPDTRDDPKIVARLERMAGKADIALPAPVEYRSAAELRRLLDSIIKERHGDSPSLARNLRNRLRLRGIHTGNEDATGTVNADLLDQFYLLAGDLGIDTQAIKRHPTAPTTRGRIKTTRGRIKQMIDRILQQQSPNAPHRTMALRTKLLLRGIDPEAYTHQTPDDPKILRLVEEIAQRLGMAP
jgi:predicted ArsR family transcriptional regulator